MAKSHERQFISIVSVVIGGLVGLAIGLLLLATHVGERSETQRLADTEYRREVQERTAPFGKVAVAGRDNTALAIAGSAPASAAAPVAATVLGGAQAYGSVCATCHAAGIGGAPKFGDKAAWAPRLGQGVVTLKSHALAGYQGKAGVMPAKGGRPDLADQSVANAVDYLVAAAK